jgi:hypothetical protein
MPISTLAGNAISNTYQRVVQTDGLYLGDGTGSLINNLALPGNLYVSGTLYANNSVVITESFYSGSNQLGNDQNDIQLLYGTVRIPTGSLTVTGSITSNIQFISTAIYPNQLAFVTSGSSASSAGFYANVWRGTWAGGAPFSFSSNAYTSSQNNLVLLATRPSTPTFGQFYLYVKTDNTTVFDLSGGSPILDIASNGTSYARFDGTNFSIGTTSSLAKIHIKGAGTTSATTALRIENANLTSSLTVTDSGRVSINDTVFGTVGQKLEVVSNVAGPIASFGARSVSAPMSYTISGDNNLNIIGSNAYFSASVYYPIFNDRYGILQKFTPQGGTGGAAYSIELISTTSSVGPVTSSVALQILNNGNIGLGTITPATKLEVYGINELLRFGDGTSGNDAYMSFNSRGYLGFAGAGGLNFIANVTRPIIFGGSGSWSSFNEWARFQTGTGYFGIGTPSPNYPLDVSGSARFTSGVIVTGSLSVSGSQNYNGNVNINGTLTATVKSFLINHPTQPGKKLQYGNLEGPEHGVYFRGKSTSNIIELPEEWTGLVDEETITVQLTSIGKHQSLYVEEIKNNKVTVGVSGWSISQPQLNYYYLVHGERKDVNKLITTIN